MGITDFLDRVVLVRRMDANLRRLADAAEVQAILLERLCNHFAPVAPVIAPDDLRQTGPSFVKEAEQAKFIDWSEGFLEKNGRPPNEDEIDEWFTEQA